MSDFHQQPPPGPMDVLCHQIFPQPQGEAFLTEIGEIFGGSWTNEETVEELKDVVKRHVEQFSIRAEFDDSEAQALGQVGCSPDERRGYLSTPFEAVMFISESIENADHPSEDLKNATSRMAAFLVAREIVYSALGFVDFSESETTEETTAAERLAVALRNYGYRFPSLVPSTASSAASISESDTPPMCDYAIAEVIFGVPINDDLVESH